jgi:epoxyqueuosine reductase
MRWLTPEWAEKASEPAKLLPNAHSVVCVALSYSGRPAGATPEGCGRIARYAVGWDYHALMRDRLDLLARGIESAGGAVRPFVDTAPTMDKALAVRAGLGWQGRNTNVLSRKLGSFIFLGGVITDLVLEPDVPAVDGCGACRACVVACPTGALKGDYTIDARLCISYLTIEHRGPIPRELRPLIGDWVFGCDICQDVCPPVAHIQDRDFPAMKQQRIEFTRSSMR